MWQVYHRKMTLCERYRDASAKQGKLEDAADMDLVNSYRNYLYQDLKIATIIKISVNAEIFL